MTSLWSNAELLYSMGTSGTTASAPGAASAILSGNSTTNTPFKMPSLRALWGMSALPSKTLRVEARGNFGTPASSPGTWLVGCGLNTTQATKPTTIVLAATGAYTPAAPNLSLAATAGAWEMEFDVVVQTAGSTPNANLFAQGIYTFGPGNNAGTSGAVALMVGSGSVVSVDPTIEYWLELYATFSTGPASTSMQCNQFLVYALN